MDNKTNNLSSWLGEYGCKMIKQHGAEALASISNQFTNLHCKYHRKQFTTLHTKQYTTLHTKQYTTLFRNSCGTACGQSINILI